MSLSNKDKLIESEIKTLVSFLSATGYRVRREQLARGHSYRVKSGDCLLSGATLLFIDKRLQLPHQLSVIVDYLMDLELTLPSELLEELTPATKNLLSKNTSAEVIPQQSQLAE